MDLNGKTALITGGGGGIGLGAAEALVREGCRVAISDLDRDRLQRAAAAYAGQPPILCRACDVTDRGNVAGLVAWAVEQLGPLDIVVHAAGINVLKRSMAELDPADFDRIMAVNCAGLYNVLHAVLPGMRQRGDGLIVSICSMSGKRAWPVAGAAYCASKFAAAALALAVGQEQRGHGVRITSIHPGEVNTPILEQRPVPVPAEQKARMVQPADIGQCIVALARLPRNVVVPELVIKPLYQDYL